MKLPSRKKDLKSSLNVGTGTFFRWEVAAMWVWKVNIEQTERQSTQGLFPALFSSQRSQTFWKHQTTYGIIVSLTFKYPSVADLTVCQFFCSPSDMTYKWLLFWWLYLILDLRTRLLLLYIITWVMIFPLLSHYPIETALILDFIEGAVGVPPFSSTSGTSALSEFDLTESHNFTSYSWHASRITLKCFYEVSFYCFWLFAAFIAAEDS